MSSFSKQIWVSPFWILPKFSAIPTVGFSVTTDPPFCFPKNQGDPLLKSSAPPPPNQAINDDDDDDDDDYDDDDDNDDNDDDGDIMIRMWSRLVRSQVDTAEKTAKLSPLGLAILGSWSGIIKKPLPLAFSSCFSQKGKLNSVKINIYLCAKTNKTR